MKILVYLLCVSVAVARPSVDDDQEDNAMATVDAPQSRTSGRPGCQTEQEMIVRVWRNNDDSHTYWECTAKDVAAVQRACPLGEWFYDLFKRCVPAGEWQHTPVFMPPSDGTAFNCGCSSSCSNSCGCPCGCNQPPPCSCSQSPCCCPTPRPPCCCTTQPPPCSCSQSPCCCTPPRPPPCSCSCTTTVCPPIVPESTTMTSCVTQGPPVLPPFPPAGIGSLRCGVADHGILFPSTNPNRFWMCTVAMIPLEMPCPAGQFFRFDLQLCARINNLSKLATF